MSTTTTLTALEKSIALGLRLSDAAAQKLLPEIQRHVGEARAELIRLGISSTKAAGTDMLIEGAIITYSIAKMSDEAHQKQYMESFTYQADNIRKSGGYT